MLIRDVLEQRTQRLITIHPGATVREALGAFVEHNIGALPVLDASGKLVGIFTERDILFGDHRDPDKFHHQHIREVMTDHPLTCGPDDAVHAVMGKMLRSKVGHLPVVEEGRVIGMVSVGDLVRALYEQAEASNQQLTAFLYGPG